MSPFVPHWFLEFAGEDMGLGLIIDTEVAKSSALVMTRSEDSWNN